jgi:hypothetical protein
VTAASSESDQRPDTQTDTPVAATTTLTSHPSSMLARSLTRSGTRRSSGPWKRSNRRPASSWSRPMTRSRSSTRSSNAHLERSTWSTWSEDPRRGACGSHGRPQDGSSYDDGDPTRLEGTSFPTVLPHRHELARGDLPHARARHRAPCRGPRARSPSGRAGRLLSTATHPYRPRRQRPRPELRICGDIGVLRSRDLDLGLTSVVGVVLVGAVPTAVRRIERRLETTAHVADLGEPAHRVSHSSHLPGRSRRPACRPALRAWTGSSRSRWSSAKDTVTS